MFAASLIEQIAALGWGVLAFPVVFVGYLLCAHLIVRGIYGARAQRGQWLASGLVVAVVLLGVGKLVRVIETATDGTIPPWLEQVLWGSGLGLALGVGALFQSLRRSKSARVVETSEVAAPPRETSPTVTPPAWILTFQAAVVGFVALCFTGFGVVFIVFATQQKEALVFGLFGALVLLAGLGLARLAWVLVRRGRAQR
jgi:uncharacterized membrane protein